MGIIKRSEDDPIEAELAARLGRHILAGCLFLVSSVWAWQGFHAGGSSPVMRDFVATFGEWTGYAFAVIAGVLFGGCFRREAKVLGGIFWGAQCLLLALRDFSLARYDLVLVMIAFSGIGLVLALMGRAGLGK